MNRKLVSIQTIPDSVREALGDNLCFKIINNTYLAKHHL